MTARSLAFVAAAAACAALVYLRDPAWLASVESGFARWERDAEGNAYRWIGGHASFFVPSNAEEVIIPLRAIPSDDWQIIATISIDDRPADRIVLADDAWRVSRLRPQLRTTRRVRRIDIRVNRTLPGNRGVQVGEVRTR